MKQIQLTQNKIAVVDDEDFESLNRFKWFAQKNKQTFYAARNEPRAAGKRTLILMHKIISGARGKIQIDHCDGDGLNNRKINLRIATNQQNSQNRRPNGLTSKFKGVFYNAARNKWQAQITVDKKRKMLGRFQTENEAARAYDAAARQNFDEFARLNFVEAGLIG